MHRHVGVALVVASHERVLRLVAAAIVTIDHIGPVDAMDDDNALALR